MFLVFLDYFDVLVLKKYYFNIFLNKKYFKKTINILSLKTRPSWRVTWPASKMMTWRQFTENIIKHLTR